MRRRSNTPKPQSENYKIILKNPNYLTKRPPGDSDEIMTIYLAINMQKLLQKTGFKEVPIRGRRYRFVGSHSIEDIMSMGCS